MCRCLSPFIQSPFLDSVKLGQHSDYTTSENDPTIYLHKNLRDAQQLLNMWPLPFLFLFSHTHNVSTFRKTHTFACILIFSTHPDCACSFFILISFLAAKILMRRKMDQVCFEKLFPSKKKLKKSFSWKLFSFLSKLWKTFPLHVCKLFLLFCFILCLSFLFLYKSSFCENIIQCSCW